MTPKTRIQPIPAYHLKKVIHAYGGKTVLDIENLTIPQGTITGLIGPNGSGKSTLLKLLAFAEKPTAGQIFYKGRAAQPFSPSIRSKVTLLTQKPYLLKRSVYDNIAYGLKIRKERRDMEKRIRKALSMVGLDFREFAGRMWHALSGGEAQRVAMAARLVLAPEVLLLDEPVASVDAKSAKLIREASLTAKERWGTTLVVASHDLQWLYSISDQQLSIHQGSIFTTGMENVLTGPFKDNKEIYLLMPLNDGQAIKLARPVMPSRTAVIRKKNISLDLTPQAELNHLNQLNGLIADMMLEKKSSHVLITILVADISFVLRQTAEQITSQNLYPGKPVVLKFKARDVDWV